MYGDSKFEEIYNNGYYDALVDIANIIKDNTDAGCMVDEIAEKLDVWSIKL